MRIAIVRGPSLNPGEMQNYLPLAMGHEVRLIGGRGASFFSPLRGMVTCPERSRRANPRSVLGLFCLGEVFSFIPGGIKFLYRFFGDPQILLGFEKAVTGFDIVHSAELANYYSFQAVKARQKGLVKRAVVTCWENIAGVREDYPAQKRIKKAVVKGADHFLAVTEGARKSLLAEGVEGKRITVVGMGVEIKKLKVKSEKLKVKNILFVGRLEEEKGVWELLEMFRILKGSKRFRDLKLTMVGKGSQEGKIKSWLKENHLEKAVRLKGWVKYEKIWQEYGQADIFVLPSKPRLAWQEPRLAWSKPSRSRIFGRPRRSRTTWQEQFGMVLVEAMASGVPIVATKSGAIPEVVGGAGILAEPGNSQKLAAVIERLIKDESLRKSLRVKGFKRAKEKYDSEKVAKKIERVYRKILNN